MDTHRDVRGHPQRLVDRQGLVEGAVGGVEVPQADPGEALEVEGTRQPDVVPRALEDPQRTAEVVGAMAATAKIPFRKWGCAKWIMVSLKRPSAPG